MTIAPQVEPIQWVSMFFLVVTLIFLLRLARRSPLHRLWSLPIIFLTIHGIIFYVSLALERLAYINLDVLYTSWSSILRLHSYITIAGYVLTFWYLCRGKSSVRFP